MHVCHSTPVDADQRLLWRSLTIMAHSIQGSRACAVPERLAKSRQHYAGNAPTNLAAAALVDARLNELGMRVW